MIASSIGIFFGSFLSLFFFRKVAHAINLVDSPNERKHHKGRIPLIGGLAIFVVVFSYLYTFPETISSSYIYLGCAGVLLAVGVLDDLLDISFKLRLLLQVGISAIMMIFAELILFDVGQLVGPFQLNLSYLGYVITVVAVVGAINAFNMVDGIDGLLGGLATVTFAAMSVLFYFSGNTELLAFSLTIVIATIPYILMNLGIPLGQRFKIFMGDAGSTVIGFTVVWLLLEGSQGDVKALSPVTALWIAAIPIMDAVSTISRRVKKGQSPFKPDREHLHHIMLRLGVGPKKTLFVICLMASVFAALGVTAEIYGVPEYIMFFSFLLIQFWYYRTMSRIWRISVKFRRFFRIGKHNKPASKRLVKS